MGLSLSSPRFLSNGWGPPQLSCCQSSTTCGASISFRRPVAQRQHRTFSRYIYFFGSLDRIRTPISGAIFKMHMPRVDRKVFTGNQPHFVANRILIGRCDPLPARFGWRDGTLDEVDLPSPPPPPVYIPASGPAGTGGNNDANWLKTKLSLMGDGPGLDGFYEVIRGVFWDYAFRVVRGGVVRNDQALIDIILYAVQSSTKGGHPRPDHAERYLSRPHMDAVDDRRSDCEADSNQTRIAKSKGRAATARAAESS